MNSLLTNKPFTRFIKSKTSIIGGICFTFAVFGLNGCVKPVSNIPQYYTQTDISKLSEQELISRLQFSNGGCLKIAKLMSELEQCKVSISKEERVRVGTTLAALHPEWTRNFKLALQSGAPVVVGMKESEVLISLGEPNDRNTTFIGMRSKSQWVYRNPDLYVYIEKGLVTALQVS